MKTRIEQFKVDHLLSLDEKTRLRLGLVPEWVEKAYAYEKSGPCYTGFVDGEVIACAGVHLLWPGCGEAWAVVTPKVYDNPLFFHRAVKNLLQHIINKHKLYRVQATVLDGFARGMKWLEVLGFECEGLMRKYLNDEDHWRYARVA